MEDNYTLKTWFLNRVLFYLLVPSTLIFLSVKKLMWFLESYDPKNGLELLTCAIVIILGFEYRIFGFQIKLLSDRMIYKDRGLPFPRKKIIFKNDILSYHFVFFDKAKKAKSGFIGLDLRDSKDNPSFYVTVSSFRPKDIQKFVDWLANIEGIKKGKDVAGRGRKSTRSE